MILKKGTKLYSIFNGKCPRCHEGDMFKSKNPYKIGEITKMNETCDHCGFKFEIEPAFFYGAMYVNYGLGVAVMVATFIIGYALFGFDPGKLIIMEAISLIALGPLMLRLSKTIYSNMFTSYDPNYASKNLAE